MCNTMLQCMKKRVVVILSLFLLLLFSCMCFAVNPFINNNVGSLTILTSNVGLYQQDKDMTLNYHVFNSTNALMTNATVNCTTHIYYPNGTHMISLKSNTSFNVADNDYYIFINSTKKQTNILGIYSILADCQNFVSGERGILQTAYEITPSGINTTLNYNGMWALIVFSIVFGIILIYIIKTLTDKQHYWFKMFLFGIICFIPFFIFLIIQSVVSKESDYFNLVTQNLWLFNIFEILMIATTMYILIVFIKFLVWDMLIKGGRKK